MELRGNESILKSAGVCFHFIDKFCVEGYGHVYKQSFNMCVVREIQGGFVL